MKVFFYSKKLLREINFIFIVFIPKTDKLEIINYFRLLSFIYIIYKVINKILFNKFKFRLNKIIGLF